MSGELVIAIINTTLYTSPHLLLRVKSQRLLLSCWRPEPVHYRDRWKPCSWVTSGPRRGRNESVPQGPKGIHVLVQMDVNSSCLRQIVKMANSSVNSNLGRLARMSTENQLSDGARRRARKFPHFCWRVAHFCASSWRRAMLTIQIVKDLLRRHLSRCGFRVIWGI